MMLRISRRVVGQRLQFVVRNNLGLWTKVYLYFLEILYQKCKAINGEDIFQTSLLCWPLFSSLQSRWRSLPEQSKESKSINI
jgi:hypothetical protein